MIDVRNIPLQAFIRRAVSLGYEPTSGVSRAQERGWMAIEVCRVRDGVLGILRLRRDERVGWLAPKFTPSAVAA
jgi:hypothetical protein